MAYLALITRTDGTEKPNDLEPDSKAFILLESIETETECFLKLRTGTEEFWNRTSTNLSSLSRLLHNKRCGHSARLSMLQSLQPFGHSSEL